MTFKIKRFTNAMKITDSFVLENYKVSIRQVMKEFPDADFVDYYEITVESKEEN